MVKTVQGRHPFELHKAACGNPAPQFFQLLISGKHFYMDGIGKIRHGQGYNGTLPADLTLLHVEDLAADGNLSHLLDDLLQRNGLILKITPVEHIRVVASADAAATAFSAKPSTAERFLTAKAACIFSGCCTSTGTGCRPGTVSRGFSSRSACCLCLFPGCFPLRLRLSFGLFFLHEALGQEGDLLAHLSLALLQALVILEIHIVHVHLHLKSTALIEHPVQNPQNIVHGFLVIDLIGDGDHHVVLIRKLHLCIFHNTSFVGAVGFQLRQHTFLIEIPQLFRRVLPGQLEFFKEIDLGLSDAENLPLNLFCNMKKLIFCNQLFAQNIHSEHITFRVRRYPGDHDLLKETM